MRSRKSPYKSEAYVLPLGFNGRFAWIYRWFSGRPMNGHRYTDATGFKYGTMSLDVSGHATTFQLLPGYKRFLYARLPAMASPFYLAMWWLRPGHAALATLALATLSSWEIDKARRTRAFRRDIIEPVAASVAAVTRTKYVTGQGHTKVSIPRDFRDNPSAKIIINLPYDWIGQDGDRANLVKVVAERLNADDLAATWTVRGQLPAVTLAMPVRPPGQVTFDLAMRARVANLPWDELAMGIGTRDKLEIFSLALESPHLAIAAGSGAGKSVLLAWLVGQLMRRGFGVAVLDAKYVSHMWLRSIPGVLYASESEELHEALVWLDQELVRRARFVANGGDPADLVPLAALLEEMNTAANRLRAYWNEIKEPGVTGMSPALVALANLASMGRQMRVHIFMAGQNLSAKSTGGPEARESFGGRALARATARQWNMLAPQIKPAPVKRNAPGRWHLVVGDTLKEFQVPFVDLENDTTVRELIAWATGGVPTPDVPSMMLDPATTTAKVENTRSEVVAGGISTRDYASRHGLDFKWLKDQITYYTTSAPEPLYVGPNRTKMYDELALDEFVMERLRASGRGSE